MAKITETKRLTIELDEKESAALAAIVTLVYVLFDGDSPQYQLAASIYNNSEIETNLSSCEDFAHLLDGVEVERLYELVCARER